MNNLEYIDLLIKSREEEVNRYTKVKNNLYDKESEAYYEKEMIGKLNEHIQQLHQIKDELEVWAICKKNSHINNYDSNNKRFDITIWLNTANCDFEGCASFEECLKVKKALDVDNSVHSVQWVEHTLKDFKGVECEKED